MASNYKCPVCGQEAETVEVSFGWITVDCIYHGLKDFREEKPEGQGSLFGQSMTEALVVLALMALQTAFMWFTLQKLCGVRGGW